MFCVVTIGNVFFHSCSQFQFAYICQRLLPLDAMRRGQHVSIVDQHSAAIETIEVAEPSHPRELVHAGRFATNDARCIVAFAATWETRRKEKKNYN